MRASSRLAFRLQARHGRLVCLLRLPGPTGARRLTFILGPSTPRLRRLELLPGGLGPEPLEAA